MEINQTNLDKFFTGLQTVFNDARLGAKTAWMQVAMEVMSGKSAEEYAWLGALPGFREWVGDRAVLALQTHGYTIKNKKFESTIGVPRDVLEDDSAGVYAPLFRAMGENAAMHPDELIFALLKAGLATLCYDGQNFFDTDHPVTDGVGGAVVNVSNYGGGANPDAWYLLDTGRAVKPLIFQKRRDYDLKRKDDPSSDKVFDRDEFQYGTDARVNAGYGLWQLAYASNQDLNATNYQAARSAMMSFKSDAGKPLGVTPNLLVVPPALEAQGLEVLKAERKANGQTNVQRGTADLLVTPWLV